MRGALAEEFTALLEAGRFRRAKDAQAWLKKRARRTLSVSGVRKVLRKLGGKLMFLRQIARTDPQALHVIIQDRAGFHLPAIDARVPANARLLPLPPYSPELNPVEKLGDLVKDQVCNRLYPNLRKLKDRILAALHP